MIVKLIITAIMIAFVTACIIIKITHKDKGLHKSEPFGDWDIGYLNYKRHE